MSKLNYGVYEISLSIGFAGADQTDDLDISEYYTKEAWNELSEYEQEDYIYTQSVENLGQSIEYGHKLKKNL